jgi:hypothetical protein
MLEAASDCRTVALVGETSVRGQFRTFNSLAGVMDEVFAVSL